MLCGNRSFRYIVAHITVLHGQSMDRGEVYLLGFRKLSESSTICDPPYDFRDKGDNTLTTRFHLKTKEIDFNTLTKHARAHFNELVLLSHITH